MTIDLKNGSNCVTNIEKCQVNDNIGILGTEEYKKGIWPRSICLWMAALYVALFIIRPWEQLFPQLGEIHFERIYALSMIAATFFFNIIQSIKHFGLRFSM